MLPRTHDARVPLRGLSRGGLRGRRPGAAVRAHDAGERPGGARRRCRVSVGSDDPGFFNYSDYEHNMMRAVRLGVTASVRATDRLSFLGELRSENFEDVS